MMNDKQTTLAQLKQTMDAFVAERDWHQFHTPKNLAMNLSVEANELLELFLWKEETVVLETKRDEIRHELADVLLSILCFSNANDIDLATAVEEKLVLAREKYPVEKCKGKPLKYTEL